MIRPAGGIDELQAQTSAQQLELLRVGLPAHSSIKDVKWPVGQHRRGPAASGFARSWDGTPIAYHWVGSGPVLVRVNGTLADRGSGAVLTGLLARYFTVVCYDRRGRGDSGDTMPYQLEREIEDLDAVLSAVGPSASVFGMCSGAVLAMRGAAAGLPIERLALYEPPFIEQGSSHRERAHRFNHDLCEALLAGRRGQAVELFLDFAGVPEGEIARLRGSAGWSLLEALAPSLAYDSAVIGHSVRGGSLPKAMAGSVPTRTAVLARVTSPYLLREAARTTAETLKDGFFRLVTGPVGLATAVATF